MVYPAIVGGGGFTRAIGHHAAARFAPVAARKPVVPVRAGNAARPIPENGDELGDDTVRAAWRVCVHGGPAVIPFCATGAARSFRAPPGLTPNHTARPRTPHTGQHH